MLIPGKGYKPGLSELLGRLWAHLRSGASPRAFAPADQTLPSVAAWEEDGALHVGFQVSASEEARKALLYRRQTQQGLAEVWEAPSGVREHRVDGVTQRFDINGRIIPSGEALIEQLPGHVIERRSRDILYMPDAAGTGAPAARSGWYGPLPDARPTPVMKVSQEAQVTPDLGKLRKKLFGEAVSGSPFQAAAEEGHASAGEIDLNALKDKVLRAAAGTPKGSSTDHLFKPLTAEEQAARMERRARSDDSGREREWVAPEWEP